MTYEEMVKLFDEGLENRPPNYELRDLDGFLKLKELGVIDTWTNNEGNIRTNDIISCAEHDQVWLSVNVEKLAEVATESDINYLIDCGIWLDEDHDSLSMFV